MVGYLVLRIASLSPSCVCVDVGICACLYHSKVCVCVLLCACLYHSKVCVCSTKKRNWHWHRCCTVFNKLMILKHEKRYLEISFLFWEKETKLKTNNIQEDWSRWYVWKTTLRIVIIKQVFVWLLISLKYNIRRFDTVSVCVLHQRYHCCNKAKNINKRWVT